MSRLREAMDAVRTNPKNAGMWVTLGEILLAERQLEKATQSFQRALQLEPTNAAAQRGLAQILLADPGGPPPGRSTPPETRTPSAPRPTAQSFQALPPTPAQRQTPPPARESAPRTARPPVETSVPVSREAPAMNRPLPRSQAGSAMEMRTPPPPPIKPTQGRMMAGILTLVLIPVLCLCALIFGLAQLI
jgi:tetratricopeptide (TPR) repeat protein